MSGFGLFEANVTSDDENKRQVREAANKLSAATYDVRERFGQFLFAARDLTEYNDRLALSKNDILKTIEPHVFPRTGTVRRVLKPLEQEFKAMRKNAAGGTAEADVTQYLPFETDNLKGINTNTFKDEIGQALYDKGLGVGNDAGGQLGVAPSSMFSAPSGGREPGWGGIGNEGVNRENTPADKSNQGQYAPNSSPKADTSGGGGGGGVNGGAGSGGGSGAGGGSGSGGGSGWSANTNTDKIGPGEYKIQQGDTYSNLAQRAGWGDDYKGFAQATGYQADNPDLIYAGDTINVKAKPGSESSTSTTSTTSPSTTTSSDGALGAAEAPAAGAAANSTSPAENSGPKPGASPASRRRADFERNLDTDVTFSPSHDELEPEGDFKGYLSDVSQGAEGKVDRDFGGTFPGGTDHDGDPAKTDFTKDATRRFAMWCRANNVRPTLAALEDYQPSDREYIFIAAGLQRLAGKHDSPWGGENDAYFNAGGVSEPPELVRDGEYPSEPPMMKREQGGRHRAPQGKHRAEARRTAAPGYNPAAPKPMKPKGVEWTSKGKPKQLNNKPDLGPQLPSNPGGSTGTTMPGATTDTKMARKHYASLCRSQGIRPTEQGFRRWAGEHSLENRPRGNAYGVPGGRYTDPTIMGPDDVNEFSQALADDDGVRKYPPLPKHRAPQHRANRRRTAAPDYLQKADEALTNLLNQKAEEFQQTIAPLQQALQTVQQAEAEAQAANPLNVMPPAGTVNVLPDPPGGAAGGAAGGNAGGGMDPNALAGLLGGDGGAPGGDPMGGGAPSMGGGDPMAAMGGGDPSQQMQMQARRGKARGGR